MCACVLKYENNLALTVHPNNDANFHRRSVRRRARNTSASDLLKIKIMKWFPWHSQTSTAPARLGTGNLSSSRF